MTATSVRAASRASAREEMVERQLRARGISDARVLDAMASVPREAFLPADLVEFAYIDAPLPIAEGQTISQPFIVALMAQALELKPDDRVLEIGTGSGYAAAILSRLATRVVSVERHGALAESARASLRGLGYDNIDVHHADGSLGWPADAPYDAIVATAAPTVVPSALLDQLAVGGRLVVPVGERNDIQMLRRFRRSGPGSLTVTEEDLGAVQFVPFLPGLGARPAAAATRAPRAATLPERIGAAAEPFDDVDSADIEPLLERIGSARLVLIGEASHGTRSSTGCGSGSRVCSSSGTGSDSSRRRRTGRTRPPSMATFAGVRRPPILRARSSPASRCGCGATSRCSSSSSGSGGETTTRRPTVGPRSGSTGSISTACTSRSRPSSSTSMTWIPTPPASPGTDTPA